MKVDVKSIVDALGKDKTEFLNDVEISTYNSRTLQLGRHKIYLGARSFGRLLGQNGCFRKEQKLRGLST